MSLKKIIFSSDFDHLEIKNVGEKFPDDYQLSILLDELKAIAEKQNSQGMTFDERLKMKSRGYPLP